MGMELNKVDVAIIGGGFYGCCLALLMKKNFTNVVIFEKGHDLLQRASSINQARVHNGYHYPRNLVTAYRSFINFPRFVLDFKKAIISDFIKLYAIARNNSMVNANQFFRIYKLMNAPIKVAGKEYKSLFNLDLIEEVFTVNEVAFDAVILKNILKEKLERNNIPVYLNYEVEKIETSLESNILLNFHNSSSICMAKHVFNCTYSQINKLLNNSGIELLPFKHEITELALVQIPEQLKNISVTVMDGPFFSFVPYPSLKLHSLSHVRYTPHCSWNEISHFQDGENELLRLSKNSNYEYMIKDAIRYLPALESTKYIKSIYDIKTVLIKNEIDDGRPILYKPNYGIKNFNIIMGGKIDNIYDILEMIDDAKKGFIA